MNKKLVCHGCNRVIPTKYFEKDDVEISKELAVKLSTNGNGYCQRCISDSVNGDFDDCYQD